MRHSRCIFVKEEDCPMLLLELSCQVCDDAKLEVVCKQAVEDFTSMGESFEVLFAMLKTLMDNLGTPVDIKLPADEILAVNRVMTALLSDTEQVTQEEVCYQRLIFYFLKL